MRSRSESGSEVEVEVEVVVVVRLLALSLSMSRRSLRQPLVPSQPATDFATDMLPVMPASTVAMARSWGTVRKAYAVPSSMPVWFVWLCQEEGGSEGGRDGWREGGRKRV